MKTIWKFPFDVTDAFTLDMPKGAEVLSVQTQGGQPCMWAMVDPQAEVERRAFRVFGTGHPVDDALELNFVATFQIRGGALVFHVFEVVEWPQTV